MSKLKAWISAARLRTLPLSVSGILVGSACAFFNILIRIKTFPFFNNYFELDNILISGMLITGLALITTLGFQILSNFANDYGDGVKGTDNEDRIGPMRALQSGAIKPHEMKRAMVITAILTLISAVALIYVSLGLDRLLISLFFLVLGITAIWAAIKYTVGDNAYGYRGLGDVFVFIFFGPVSVMGIYFLITQQLHWWTILPSITIGLLSVAVLNLNNMRDLESDRKSGKNTIVVKMGFEKAKRFHFYILGIAMICGLLMIIFNCLTIYYFGDESFVFLGYGMPLIAFIPLLKHLKRVRQTTNPIELDPELKKVALSTFLFAILMIVSVAILTN